MVKALLVILCVAIPGAALAQSSDMRQQHTRDTLGKGAGAGFDAERVRLLDSLAAGRRRWKASGVREYEIETHVGCFCAPLPPDSLPRGSLLTVRDGRVIARAKGREHEAEAALLTVDSLFSEVETDLREPGRVVKRLVLDPVYGFPAWYQAATPRIPDVWLEFRVDTFVVHVERRP